jgi:hypothetical protein
MSYANYGPTFRTQSVANLAGAITVPATAPGPAPAEVVTALIKSAAGALLVNEIPLVLQEGTYIVSARAAQNLENGAGTYQYIQCRLENTAGGADIADGPVQVGADVLDGHNIEIYHQCSAIVTVAPGATLSMAYRVHITGNSLQVVFSGGYAAIEATKISA